MINNFLAGKKKYSVFLLTFLTAGVQMVIHDPETQKQLLDFMPTLAMMLSGIAYLIIEGWNDVQRQKSNAEMYKVQTIGSTITPTTLQPQPASPREEIQPIKTVPLEEVKPFDVKTFHESVMASVAQTYIEVNPATVYYQARDKGKLADCQHISQTQDYWAYLVGLAYEALAYIRAIVEKDKPVGGCKPRSPELYAAEQDLRTILKMADNLEALAEAGINWKAKLPSN